MITLVLMCWQVLAMSATFSANALSGIERLMRRPQRIMLAPDHVSLLGVRQFYSLVPGTLLVLLCSLPPGALASTHCHTLATGALVFPLCSGGFSMVLGALVLLYCLEKLQPLVLYLDYLRHMCRGEQRPGAAGGQGARVPGAGSAPELHAGGALLCAPARGGLAGAAPVRRRLPGRVPVRRDYYILGLSYSLSPIISQQSVCRGFSADAPPVRRAFSSRLLVERGSCTAPESSTACSHVPVSYQHRRFGWHQACAMRP